MSSDTPRFEVTTPEDAAASRRLVTAAEVRAIIASPAGDDATLEVFIDAVSAGGAKYCGLAADIAGTIPTFASEIVRATWAARSDCGYRSDVLLLPWRTPVTAIGAVTEGGVALTEDTDYQLLGGAMLQRLSGGVPTNWASTAIVVPYTAGWDLPTDAPPDLKMAVIEQVKTMYLARSRDQTLRSESTERVGSATYSVAGGDSIEDNGLMVQVASAFDRYRSRALG